MMRDIRIPVAWVILAVLRTSIAVSQTSPHGDLNIACMRCHTTTSWTTIRSPLLFDHDSTGFPLRDQHGNVPCEQCHKNLVFATTPTRCQSCHEDVHRGELGALCERCHSAKSWLVPDMRQRHAQTRFTLLGAHMTAPCQECHTNEQKFEFVNVPVDCYSCHRAQYDATVAPNHRAAGFGTNCIECHSPSALSWPSDFDHSKTPFALVGAHAATPCVQCHANNNFANTPMQCDACHHTQFMAATNPNHQAAGFSQNCQTCHSSVSWQGSTFDHGTTGFPLTGAHASQPCAACHTQSVFKGISTSCVSCHLAEFKATSNPPHVTGGFSSDCTACHTTTAWQPAQFDHAKSSFPLTGAHASVPCASCHVNNNFASIPTACAGCHQKDFSATTNPPHGSGGFSTDCTTCHTTTAWQPSTFNHGTTKFPLTGAHAAVTPCTRCHTVSPWSAQSMQCVNCHQADFNGTTNPPHVSGGFPTDCTTCHTAIAWQPATFDHSKTTFPLTGAHASVPCASCHVNNNFTSIPSTCVGCHQTEFNGTTSPPHASGGFSTDCTTCHTTTAWQPSTFNHSTTKFPLTGAHATVTPCTKCHTVSPWSAQSTQCVSCHQADYNATNNPPHVSGGFPTDCTTCHTTTAWQPATFDHSKTTFPLTGAHSSVPCASCHVNNNFTSIPSTCVGCHQTDFNGTTNPPHASGGFSTDCTTCHSTTAWQPSTFNHSTTKFPLTGAHATVTPCTKCHTVSPWSAQSTQCISCHQADFNATNNPPHTGFPTDCTTCHTTTAWQPASFDHSTTSFPLTGAHASVPCASCHVNNNFTTLPTACVGCHQTDFNGATNPPHASAGFATDCTTCHTTTAWQPSTFNHNNTSFPLTGAHTSVTPCTACHTVSPWSSQSTACVSCHQTDYNNTTNPNHASAGFPTTCQTCHTTTSWAGATFNHTWFPQTHGNSGGVCATCHINPADYSVFSCMTGSCHPQAQTDPHHTGVSGYQYVSTACYNCHPTGRGG